jgi:small subunit ribosomal protein S17
MKKFKGIVVSTKTAKTATVEVESWHVHPIYKKRIKRKKRYHVHDEFGVQEGQVVEFVETRPISKTKKWKIVKVENGAKKKRTDSS